MTTLFDPLRVGDIELATRICMAPLTRNRAGAGQLPTDLMRRYYEQRANPATGAALIITEATQISAMGQGYLDTPGIHTPEQVAAWRRITDAVHARGARSLAHQHHGALEFVERHRQRLARVQAQVIRWLVEQ